MHDKIKVSKKTPRLSRPKAVGKRRLLTGEHATEFDTVIRLACVETRCPGKWALVDMEEGHVYAWSAPGVTGNIFANPPPLAKAALKFAIVAMIVLPAQLKAAKGLKESRA